ncbi:stress protein, member of the CspA-family [Legionella quinlivanii]|uniref:Stress protein, member of the CspA-family n=1 Tax=Legionella quinlivanii TaxID=45073 RepID=A0A0W0Y2U1_9GAMM|nr:cold shock domain-containing protein [Legionella quinlivanii]KTD51383.1 stress protein, member of the CspA-family [Legionella quinlivanii]MCW8451634.1 cold shock domain-containing protein [Legionella quinlivanii]SEG12298.1 cold shock protein (beta-ribbon, CspA family) [Legionella quinlivanii DSM 21216]STY10143.1 stress protein, member of the CspA-family [Legionella quinlivanii]
MTERLTGKVKWFDPKKGFGFIHAEGQDYFVHFRNIQATGFRTLTEGAEVSFSPCKEDKGLKACEVEIINPA